MAKPNSIFNLCDVCTSTLKSLTLLGNFASVVASLKKKKQNNKNEH